MSRSARHAGFVDGLELFDHRRFHVSAREALEMEPRQRVALEVSHEALGDVVAKGGAVYVGCEGYSEWRSELCGSG